MLNRRRFLKYAGATAAVVAGAAYYYLEVKPRLPAVLPSSILTTQNPATSTTITTSPQSLSDYLKSNGVPDAVADLASSYGTLDTNKKALADFIIKIKDIEPGIAPSYQSNLLSVLTKEDPNDISAERLETLRYMFSDQSLAINMLGFSMYPGVFDYLDTVISKYPDIDKRMFYATLGIPRFQTVFPEEEELFEEILQRGTNQQFKPAFDQMLSEGNVDKSKFTGRERGHFTAIWTPMESWIWEYLDNDKRADSFLENYDMKALVNDAFRNTTASGNYESEEWQSWDTASNRLGFNSWISWKWVKDNMSYDRSLAGKPHIYISPEDVYAEKLSRGIATGDCLHAADFCLQNLARGAIKASVLNFIYDDPSAGRQNHYVTLEYRNESDIWVVMNFGYDGAEPIIGPVKTEFDAANASVDALGGGGIVKWTSIYEKVNYDL